MTFWRVLLWAWVASVVCIVIGAPLAQATGWEDSGTGALFGRILGHSLLAASMLLLVHGPVFFGLRRICSIAPTPATIIGVVIPLVAVLLLSNPTAETWTEKVQETVETYVDHPELLVSEWLSIFVGGGVFGFLHSRRYVVKGTPPSQVRVQRYR
jgi:hypothetical protein